MWPTPLARDKKDGPITSCINIPEKGMLGRAVHLRHTDNWPTPTTFPCRPNEGNVRILRQKVRDGELSLEEAKGMLGGKDPFEAQGKLDKEIFRTPTATERSGVNTKTGSGGGLTEQVKNFPTPQARDYKGPSG